MPDPRPTEREIHLSSRVLALEMVLNYLMVILARGEDLTSNLDRITWAIDRHEILPEGYPLGKGWGDADREALSSGVRKAAAEIVSAVKLQVPGS